MNEDEGSKDTNELYEEMKSLRPNAKLGFTDNPPLSKEYLDSLERYLDSSKNPNGTD